MMRDDSMTEQQKKRAGLILLGVVVALLIGIFFLYPMWNVWASEQEGKAEYQKATQDRAIKILEATADEEAAKHKYNTTLINAKAHADSIAIIGEQLKLHPSYLTYMWIEDTGDAGDTTYIYVPSGAYGMPTPEAGRFFEKAAAQAAQANSP